MKTKKTISSIIFVLAIVGTILYLFLAPRPLGNEYQFNPVWKINTLSQVSEISADVPKMYFHLGQSLGYFTDDGKISLFNQFQDKASISDTYYALYNSDSKDIPFYYSNGIQAGTIKAAGYPFFVDDQIYIFLPGGASFAKCYSNGDVSWRYEGTLPITAFSAKKNYLAVGFADGTIKVFETTDGNCIINFAPGGSDYPVILGVDISEDGEYIASVSGHEKQRFVLAHREENQPKIIYHSFIKEGLPYRTLVHFTQDGKQVIYNYQNNIGVYDLASGKKNTYSIKTKIISIEETENLLFLLGHEKEDYTVYMIEKTNLMEGSFSFKADTAFIKTKGEDLYVGKDNTISRIEIARD